MQILHIKTTGALMLFLIQYISLVYLLISGPLIPVSWPTWIPYLSGWILGIWAILAMGSGNLNAGPDILPSARLVSAGPYRMIRHPMYAAILLVLTPLVITSPGTPRIIIMIILCLNLLFKIRYEERRLKEGFDLYSEYSSRTWRLLPYVY